MAKCVCVCLFWSWYPSFVSFLKGSQKEHILRHFGGPGLSEDPQRNGPSGLEMSGRLQVGKMVDQGLMIESYR